MNQIAIYQALQQAAWNAGDVSTMPPETLWETAAKSWGIFGVMAVAFLWGTMQLGRWAGPILAGMFQGHQKLVESFAETQRQNADRLDRIERSLASVARRQSRISSVISERCGKHLDTDDSDDEIDPHGSDSTEIKPK